MINKEEIINIITNKNIKALKDWISRGGDAKMILEDSGYKESLIQYVIEEIEKEEEEELYLNLIEILINNGADVNYFNDAFESPAFQLVSLNKPKLLKLILENGADINFVGDESLTPLLRACLDQNVELVELILKYSTTEFINKSGSLHVKTPLGLALYYNNLDIIELLLQNNADPYSKDGEGDLTIESIPRDIDEDLKK